MISILGISAFHHDSAAAVVVDGEIVAAAQEERFTRRRHDESFPTHAVDWCLRKAGLRPERLDYVGFYDKPVLKFLRLLDTYMAYAPRGFASFRRTMPVWLRQKLHVPREIRAGLGGRFSRRCIFTPHHESHAASAFFPSPFDEAAILTLDGEGEWATASYGNGRGNRIRLLGETRFPHSPGLLYSAFTDYCGFDAGSDEYELMDLAPYGEPRYAPLILDKLVDLRDDGSFRMDMTYFDYCRGLTPTSRRFHDLFGRPPRRPEAPITPLDRDLAASIQNVTEEILLRSARHVHERTGAAKLCLAGGVALNGAASGRVLREGPFEDLWIQPAAGDAGGALGVALFIWHQMLGKPRQPRGGDSQRGSLLGPSYGDDEIRSFLETTRTVWEAAGDERELCGRVAAEIAAGRVVGWFQGPMEFGPWALGNRSILADPRNGATATALNLKVKFREGFRPFGPAVLRERAAEVFDVPRDLDSPYMLLVAPVRARRRPAGAGEGAGDEGSVASGERRLAGVPAVTHVDASARIQTVDAGRHGLFRALLEEFHRRTGCPAVLNTSFNLGRDPVVRSPREAYEAFMSSDIDVLCMGRFILDKAAQPASVRPVAGGGRDEPLRDLMTSPCHGADLASNEGAFVCTVCSRRFGQQDGIRTMYWPHERVGDDDDVTERVRAFYEENPFPDYDEHDTVRSLIEKSRRSAYAHALDRSIPFNGTVLEVGCGTGQLGNFLGISCRRVVATDLCLNSLRLGERFRRDHGLERVWFVQMNLFRPCFGRERFDMILCNGVLHHTSDPFGGFRGLLPLLKPGGHIVVGLYNRYGRLMTDLRRRVFRLTGGRARWLDPILRARRRDDAKSRAWFADQYRNPHESKHTIGEVMGWFRRSGVEFVRGVPSVAAGPTSVTGVDLFEPEPPGTALDHFLVQAREVVTGSREGGFFVMIGRKRGVDAGAESR